MTEEENLPFGQRAGYFVTPEEYLRMAVLESRILDAERELLLARSLLRRTVGIINYQGRYPGRLCQLADDIDRFLEN